MTNNRLPRGELGKLLDRHLKAGRFQPSDARIAELVGFSTSALSKWMAGRNRPTAEHLHQLADRTDIPYEELLLAADADSGYRDRPGFIGDVEVDGLTGHSTETEPPDKQPPGRRAKPKR